MPFRDMAGEVYRGQNGGVPVHVVSRQVGTGGKVRTKLLRLVMPRVSLRSTEDMPYQHYMWRSIRSTNKHPSTSLHFGSKQSHFGSRFSPSSPFSLPNPIVTAAKPVDKWRVAREAEGCPSKADSNKTSKAFWLTWDPPGEARSAAFTVIIGA